MKILAALALAGVALLSTPSADADGRSTLVAVNGDGIRTTLAVTLSSDICDSIAYRLNFYAQLPPEDEVRFYCRGY